MGLFIDLMKGAREIEKMEQAYQNSIKRAMKIGIVEALRQVTISTPVDLGRARWGWYLTVNVPSPEIPPEGEYKAPDVTEKIAGLSDNFTVDDTLYLTNNVPYVIYLNEGSSTQAPARFVEKSADIAQQAVLRYLKSGKS